MKPFLILSSLVCCMVLSLVFVNTIDGVIRPFWGAMGTVILCGALLGCIETLKEL